MSPIAKAASVSEGTLTKVKHEGKTYVLTRVGSDYYAIENRCPHFGWSFVGGKVEGGVLTCPWHGSRYDVCSGENLDWVNGILGLKIPRWSRSLVALGQAPSPVTTYKLEVAGDDLVLPGK